ncbi:MAG: hypothetical protein EA400_12975 [Chromatiaceae bacterium]|nr:MAG: hypothetical protein EA400_12975 [Chromatiaceae bacterium]
MSRLGMLLCMAAAWVLIIRCRRLSNASKSPLIRTLIYYLVWVVYPSVDAVAELPWVAAARDPTGRA